MARREEDREDLLAEAVALSERIALQVAGHEEPVVAGFRKQGAASFYFGADPAYHFTSDGRLRRAFAGGLLYKAERGRLVSLDRQRSAGEVCLVRHDLDDAQTERFLKEATRRLDELRQALETGGWQIVGQVPPTADVVGRVRTWLAEHAASVRPADSARVQ